ncbi:MAG: type II toxin-antitoxin system VapC family toxin [Acidobacteria bacterium]|nr:type II toxin-antitoxin system VapC family toxin [Acidobacteriota bacterium]
MRLVLDASVVIKWFLEDPTAEDDVDQALEILGTLRGGSLEVLQPVHWLVEVAAVLTRLQPDSAGRALDLLDAMELAVVSDHATLRRASDLAHRLHHHLFDTLYHAVALEHEAILVTADQTYWKRARRLGGIALLSSWGQQITAGS